MFVLRERDCSKRFTTKLDAGDLYDNSEYENNEEERIVEKVFEYVDLI